jgi:large subunit ribosomal protein L4e
MCRKGRMFAPTKTWRRWHRKVNTTQKRFAVASAVSATAVPALVMARGHRVSAVPELPLILSAEDCASIKKTSQAVTALNNLHCDEDIDRVKNSRKLRAGKGKMRGRRFVQRRGPLVIASSKLDGSNLGRALRNIPGVEIADVDRLNILQLAPGGHVGRFVIWTEQAWNSLQQSALGSGKYSGSVMMSNPDVARIINSD